MKQWIAPLWVFVLLEFGTLFIYLFMPSVDSSVSTLNTTTAGSSSFIWGWSWLMTNGVVRMMIYVFYQLFIAFVVGMTFLQSRKT